MYCLRLFTGFFYKNYIVYYNVYCYYMCIPSFVLIGYCVHGNICPYCNVWPEAIVVLQELNCLHVCMIRARGWYPITKFCYSTPSGF